MLEEIKESIKNNLNDKIFNPFWGAFIISWILWNWNIFYLTFFIDSELLFKKENILKIDYIKNIYQWNNFLNIFSNLFHLLFFPLISSYVIIFWLPKLTSIFYEKYLENENQNKLLKIKKEEEFLKIKSQKLEKEKTILKEEADIRKIQAERPKEEIWGEEYNIFRKTKYFKEFAVLKEIIYSYNGNSTLSDTGFFENKARITSDFKAYCDANKIIQINYDSGFEKLILTEKGKFFMKKFTEEIY